MGRKRIGHASIVSRCKQYVEVYCNRVKVHVFNQAKVDYSAAGCDQYASRPMRAYLDLCSYALVVLGWLMT